MASLIQYSETLLNNGAIIPNGRVYTYEQGSDAPKKTYTTAAGTTVSANPIILGADGTASFFMHNTAYRFDVRNSSDVSLYVLDPVVPGAASNTVAANTAALFSSASTTANAYTATANDGLILASAANVTTPNQVVNLPTAAGNTGKRLTIVKTDASFRYVVVDAYGSETIGGQSSYTLTDYLQSVTLASDGTNWVIVT